MSKKQIYQLSDGICFRICEFDDCTDKDSHWSGHELRCALAQCNHEGTVHFHCCIHRDVELASQFNSVIYTYTCVTCDDDPDREFSPVLELDYRQLDTTKQKAKSLLNSSKFKNAKFIRLDEYYAPEISEKDLTEKGSKYWVSYDLKSTETGETLMILYIGHKADGTKAQFFIKPESKKLSHDHADKDPLSIISRIEVKFKDGSIELKENDDAE